jgi:hypothetical protein
MGPERMAEMDCKVRERLEAALNEALNHRQELDKKRRAAMSEADPKFGQFKADIKEATVVVNRAQNTLQEHRDTCKICMDEA